MLSRIKAALEFLLSCPRHMWSRAFYCREERYDYQVCVRCGLRRRSAIQFRHLI